MNTFVAILFVILGLLFIVFFCYEVYCLVRDIKKHREKKKKNREKLSDDKNTMK